MSSLDDLGYKRYSIIEDEDCHVELEYLAGIVSIHFTPVQWSHEWVKYYKYLFSEIKEALIQVGFTRIVNIIKDDEPKKVKLHRMFGFVDVGAWEDHRVMVLEFPYLGDKNG